MSARSAFGREKHNTMPSTSRCQQKAEAMYNVTTDYPQYDLHFAAASGNLGLVEFAVSHGQPVNSVLNGVLPLHAACAGGSEIVVRYLIEGGADVNAPRLPRRYSNDKHKSSGLALGASGSTPLHFAAANGHSGVVRLLLSHGAVPDRADKLGFTPEALAQKKGWIECVNLLAQWSDSRADDLPSIKPEDRNDGAHSNFSSAGVSEYDVPAPLDRCTEKRAQVKRSIDNALHLFKSPLQLHHHYSTGQLRLSPSSTGLNISQSHPYYPPHTLQSSHSHSTVQTLPPAAELLTEHTGESTALAPPSPQSHGDRLFGVSLTRLSSNSLEDAPTQRRPSLPQIFGAEPISPFQRRLSGKKKRPCSAGTDTQRAGILNRDSVAHQEDSSKDNGSASPQGHSGAYSTIGSMLTPHKASSKISLRNLFRRANGSVETGLGSSSELGSGSASGTTSYSTSPVPVQLYVQRSHSINRGSPHAPSRSMTPPASPTSGIFALSTSPDTESGRSSGTGWTPGVWYRNRKASENAAPRIPLVPEHGELHSRSSREDMFSTSLNEARPSILRSHLRCTSSQSSAGSGSRALRFEPKSGTFEMSGTPPNTREGSMFSASAERPPVTAIRGCRSTSSLKHNETADENGPEQGATHILSPARVPPSDGLAGSSVNKTEISGPTGADLHPASAHTHPVRHRGASFASSTSSSQGVSPHNSDIRSTYVSSEFSFSPERSPLTPISATYASTATAHEVSEDIAAVVAGMGQELSARNEARLRGESFSSADTDGSASASATLSSDRSTNIDIAIPSPEMSPVPPTLPETNPPQTVHPTSDMVYIGGSPSSSLEDIIVPSPAMTRRSPAYTPLDLRGISNLAEAEALVRRTQQEILVSAELPEEGPDSLGIPLSVQLAAYGEILALERRFARGEKQREQWTHRSESEEEKEFGSLPPHSAKEGRDSSRSASQVRREISARRRAPAAAEQVAIVESKYPQIVQSAKLNSSSAHTKRLKHKRPHTAEGNIKSEWNFASLREASGEYASAHNKNEVADGYIMPPESGSKELDQLHMPLLAQLHSELSPSSDLRDQESKQYSEIQIVETVASPIDPPATPEGVKRSLSSESVADYMTASFATARPARSRTPDPNPIRVAVDTDVGVNGGVPLLRVSTAPLQHLQMERRPELGVLQPNVPAHRLDGNSHKFARMGFAIDAPLSGERQYSPTESNNMSRSPPKHHIFEGIKSFVQGLRGKS